MIRVLVAAVVVVQLVSASSASAQWRGAVDLGIGGYRSREVSGTRIGAAGIVLATYVERAPREGSLAIRGTLSADVFGPVVIGLGERAIAVADSSIIGIHGRVGLAWSPRRRWTFGTGLGLGRTFYTSPSVTGDTGLVPSVALTAEWFATRARRWGAGLSARLAVDLDGEPAGTRVAAAMTLGGVLVLGRRSR